MSKRWRDKPCVYCLARAEGDDHVIARQFFVERRRADLPKVAACRACNNEKSKLEQYLTGILPFAGRHQDARENMGRLPARIAKNPELRGMSLAYEPMRIAAAVGRSR